MSVLHIYNIKIIMLDRHSYNISCNTYFIARRLDIRDELSRLHRER